MKIYNSDCFKILPQIENKSINLILTDPPYFISRKSYFTKSSNNNRFNKLDNDFGEWDKG